MSGHLALDHRRLLRIGCLLAVLGGVVALAPPLWVNWKLSRARAALAERDVDAARDHLSSARLWDPDNSELEFLMARACRRRGRLDLVRHHLERAYRLGFDLERIRREEWLAQAQGGQFSQAGRHLSRLLRDPRGDGQAICEAFVDGYFASYRFSEALPLLRAWERDFPEDPQPHVYWGLFYSHTSNLPEAARSWRRALELAPGRSDVRKRLARLLVQTHEYDEAARHFQECLAEGSDHLELLCGWGQCLVGLGRTDEAREVFADVLRTRPGHSEARFSMAQLTLTEGRAQKAVSLLAPLARERPTDAQVRYTLARALVASGQSAAAREHFQFVAEAQQRMQEVQKLAQELTDRPSDAELRYRIGTLLMHYDEPSHGAAWLQSVLELNAQHRGAHAALAEYHASAGNQPLADEHRRLAEHHGDMP